MIHKFQYILLSVAQTFFGMIGLKHSRAFARLLGKWIYLIIPIRKGVVLKNLAIAFPGKTALELRDLTKKIYSSIATVFVEILCIKSMTREEMIANVSFPRLELVRERYKEGKGVILMSAHFGNWEFAAISIGLQLGFPVTGITKDQSNQFVTAELSSLRTKWGNKAVKLGVSIREVYKALKSKEVVAMVGDQRGPSDGPRVMMFGRSSAAYTGPAALALKTGAPLIFGAMFRKEDETYEFRMTEISKENLPADDNEAITEMTQRHTTLLEDAIRQQPEAWLWLHNRWKY